VLCCVQPPRRGRLVVITARMANPILDVLTESLPFCRHPPRSSRGRRSGRD
jgi:hypothetical protein